MDFEKVASCCLGYRYTALMLSYYTYQALG